MHSDTGSTTGVTAAALARVEAARKRAIWAEENIMTNDTTTAPAPAADAATGERTQGPDWRARALEAEARVDSIDAELGRTYRDLDAAAIERDAALRRLEFERDQNLRTENYAGARYLAAEAERDLARQMLADFTEANNDVIRQLQDNAVATEAERDRLALEVAALRGAIAELAAAADDSEWHYSEDCEVEGRTDCRLCAAIRAALSATPPAAEAVTGAGEATHAS